MCVHVELSEDTSLSPVKERIGGGPGSVDGMGVVLSL